MISVVVLGGGNLAYHLVKSFLNADNVRVEQVFLRDTSKFSLYSKKIDVTDSYKRLKKADVYIIAVSDSAISEVSENINNRQGVVVHTSGGNSINILKNTGAKGVFYPLQTFSKAKEISFKNIPLCIEAENEQDFRVLERLANAVSNTVYKITSEQRSQLHIAAVFANNFTNHMLTIAEKICKENDLPFQILIPLVEETVSKISKLSPFEAQTGPAKRNDTQTIKNHLKKLDSYNKNLYLALSNSIIKLYNK